MSPRARTGTPPDPTLTDDERFEGLFTQQSLRRTWTQIRHEARSHSIRDVLDWLDWSTTIDQHLPEIREQVLSGEYTPSAPSRYELAKGKGAYRIMTRLCIKDALIYRHISDHTLVLANPHKVKGAYFSRRHSSTPIGPTFDPTDDPYSRFFEIWLRYNEYRTRTMLNQPYEVLVVSDISNYFDSIAHDLLIEYLSPLGLPRKATGLLGRILEVTKPRAGHSPNPRIGIPVDEFDCSRQLAHVFLFEHDKRIVAEVGEENYVRWMDDQNVGARSRTEARQIVNTLTRSLSTQRLTLNTGKTQFLTPSSVSAHFQLEANTSINQWQERYRRITPGNIEEATNAFTVLWTTIEASATFEKGAWDKILKRVYSIAARVSSPLLDDRMYGDLVDSPHLDERIFSCLALRSETEKLLTLFKRYRLRGESLFEATEAMFFESCLLCDADQSEELQIRELAKRFSMGAARGQSPRPVGRSTALLCLYWFGAPAESIPEVFEPAEARKLSTEIARSWLAITAARIPTAFTSVQNHLIGHPSDDVARLSRFLTDLLQGRIQSIGKYIDLRTRGIGQPKFVDARCWMKLELLAKSESSALQATARRDLLRLTPYAIRRQEKRVLARVRRSLAL